MACFDVKWAFLKKTVLMIDHMYNIYHVMAGSYLGRNASNVACDCFP